VADERPLPRLPPDVTRLVRASRVLSEGQKLVWMEDWILDHGPEGSWLNHAKLGARLGLEAETVETYRRRMERWGLYWRHPRPDGRSPGWCPMIAKKYWPQSQRPDDVAAAVTVLDTALRLAGAPRGGSTSAAKRRGVTPQTADNDPPGSGPPSADADRTPVCLGADNGAEEARLASTAFDLDSLGEHSPSTALSSTGTRVSPLGPKAKAIDPALDLTLRLIERRVAHGVLTREQADLERRRILAL
jgi:hypothetical protein